MKYVGIDLHLKSITIYVVNQERQKLDYQRFACSARPSDRSAIPHRRSHAHARASP
jgi:hypothetical protein